MPLSRPFRFWRALCESNSPKTRRVFLVKRDAKSTNRNYRRRPKSLEGRARYADQEKKAGACRAAGKRAPARRPLENQDYKSAREDLEFMDGRIDELSYVIDNATIAKKNGKTGVVAIGTNVTVK